MLPPVSADPSRVSLRASAQLHLPGRLGDAPLQRGQRRLLRLRRRQRRAGHGRVRGPRARVVLVRQRRARPRPRARRARQRRDLRPRVLRRLGRVGDGRVRRPVRRGRARVPRARRGRDQGPKDGRQDPVDVHQARAEGARAARGRTLAQARRAARQGDGGRSGQARPGQRRGQKQRRPRAEKAVAAVQVARGAPRRAGPPARAHRPCAGRARDRARHPRRAVQGLQPKLPGHGRQGGRRRLPGAHGARWRGRRHGRRRGRGRGGRGQARRQRRAAGRDHGRPTRRRARRRPRGCAPHGAWRWRRRGREPVVPHRRVHPGRALRLLRRRARRRHRPAHPDRVDRQGPGERGKGQGRRPAARGRRARAAPGADQGRQHALARRQDDRGHARAHARRLRPAGRVEKARRDVHRHGRGRLHVRGLLFRQGDAAEQQGQLVQQSWLVCRLERRSRRRQLRVLHEAKLQERREMLERPDALGRARPLVRHGQRAAVRGRAGKVRVQVQGDDAGALLAARRAGARARVARARGQGRAVRPGQGAQGAVAGDLEGERGWRGPCGKYASVMARAGPARKLSLGLEETAGMQAW